MKEPVDRATPLLELREVDLSYGPYRALFGVSLEVPDGCAVALVGPNGAGKTSIARVASGLVRAQRGSVHFAGRDVTRWHAWKIARAGLFHVPEGRSVIASLTVEENLLLAIDNLGGRNSPEEALERAYGLFAQLAAHRRQMAGTLSGGEQHMLAIARAVAVPQRLLVVDELSLGLAPAVLDELFEALERIHGEGTSLLIVEQHLERLLVLAERIVLVSRGRVVAEGPTAEVAPLASEVLVGPPPPVERSQAERPR